MGSKISIEEIIDEVNQIKRHHNLRDDSAFVFWFLMAFLSDSEDAALNSLIGDKKDKSIDAIFIDDKSYQVHLIQGKFHKSLGTYTEKRNDVLALADMGDYPWKSKESIKVFYSNMDPLVRQKFEELVERVCNKKYELKLYYVTTGRCSDTIKDEAKEKVRSTNKPVEIFILDATQVTTIFKDYIEGVAPAIPSLKLKISSEGYVRDEGVIHRYDPHKQIESWVFSMSTKYIGELYKKTGVRLFARNIRGYLGPSNDINEAMDNTIRREPYNFWYYNNGITIVCDEAKRETHKGQDFLYIERPQVINGQQTTRTLHNNSSPKASLLVKVIKIPRKSGDEDEYDDLVSSIVRATNWQNAIKPSDLVSNDYIQVFLERELRKRNYQYLRKRQSKAEAKLYYGRQYPFQIKKEELAQAIAGCEFDSSLLRKGKERLFDERYYRSIFKSRSLEFYLSRYWLMRRVQSSAHGYPERAYAKWLVLHFVWERLSKYLSSKINQCLFILVCERSYNEILGHMRKAIDGIFRAALTFYQNNRGEGEEAKDVSTFFQLSKLNEEFLRFWHSEKNSHKIESEEELEKFQIELEKFKNETYDKVGSKDLIDEYIYK